MTFALVGMTQLLLAPLAHAQSAMMVGGTTTNGRLNPIGIPDGPPTFGWTLSSPNRGARQTAYEIRVGRTPAAADVWSTGRVASDRQVDIRYTGPALSPATRYHWSVRSWDGAGTASAWSPDATFETGLVRAADWGPAQWITPPPAAANPAADWTDYTARIEFSLNNAAFGVFLRARDADNALMMQLNVTGPDPALVVHRRSGGAYTIVSTVNLASQGFTRSGLLAGRHVLQFEVAGSSIRTTLDGRLVDSRTDTTSTTGVIGFRTHAAAGERGTVHDAVVTRSDGRVLLDTDFGSGRNPFGGGEIVGSSLVVSDSTDALYGLESGRQPLLCKPFTVPTGQTVASARIYASALGVYELTLDGRPVGDQELAPGWTNYHQRIQAQTYDVTAALTAGQHVIGAALAPGWWAGKVGLGWSRQYGDRLALVARMRIAYTDGTVQWIDTDTSWTAGQGPFLLGDLQDGETYDARLLPAGWDRPGFSAAGWAPATTVPSLTARLVAQSDEPVRRTQILDARRMTQPSPGVFVYDLGQNMVGVSRLTMTGSAGQTARIRYAEVLNPDGTLYTANLRSARATDRYVFAATGTVTHEPTFTQHGFRYIEITGVSTAPPLDAVKGVVWGSDLRSTGSFSTSHPMLNQLSSNISWSQRSNFLSIPTDTPARDERLGWTGDISLFAPTANFLVDTRAFLAHWMADVRNSQYPNGDLPAVVPTPQGQFGDSGVGWSDAMITVPHAVWQAYGDTGIVRDNWEAMKRFFAFVRTSAGPDLLEPGRTTFFTNDWLHLDDPTVQGVLGTAYFAEDARMMAELAGVMGDTAAATEFTALSADVRRAFTRAYVATDGTVAGNSQTGYALALGMNLVSDQTLVPRVGERFVAKLATTDFHLRTGFIGTPLLLPALSKIGRDDLAFRMLLHEDYPSWGYEVAKGATTVWERWNSIQPDGSFGPVDMNSFNHYAYGAVGEWMYRTIGGLSPLEPGYRRAKVAPVRGGGLSQGSAAVDTVYGRLSSAWTAIDGRFTLDVTVPVNTLAQVHVPGSDPGLVTEGAGPAGNAAGVRYLRTENGASVFEVGSGTYRFATGSVPVLDQVDVGDAASENAHRLVASPTSGIGVEAGLTRRYTNDSVGNGWFELQVRVPTDRAFTVRAVETYHLSQTKTYDVLVDGVIAHQRRHQRTEGGGTVSYEFVVAPSSRTADGSVVLRYQDVPGDFDPSIADIRISPV